jgi:hypothetical protein
MRAAARRRHLACGLGRSAAWHSASAAERWRQPIIRVEKKVGCAGNSDARGSSGSGATRVRLGLIALATGACTPLAPSSTAVSAMAPSAKGERAPIQRVQARSRRCSLRSRYSG